MAFVAFAQWMNQTYNAGVNYANRAVAPPGQAEASTGRLAMAYAAAVGSSCAIALGLSAANRRAQHVLAAKPLLAAAARGVIPYTAGAGREPEGAGLRWAGATPGSAGAHPGASGGGPVQWPWPACSTSA